MIPQSLSAHGWHRLPWVTLAVSAFCVALFAALGPAPDILIYDRTAVEAGQWWRVVTGHLVHLDIQHLATNAGAFLALGILFEASPWGGSARLLASIAASFAVISAALYFTTPGTIYFAGLSAALNALYVATMLGMWWQTGRSLWLFAFGLDLAKVSWEAAFGSLFSGALAWPPHSGAHFAGILTGCLLAIAMARGNGSALRTQVG